MKGGTFKGHHEVFEGLLVETVGFLIVLLFIFFDCAFDYVNGFLLVSLFNRRRRQRGSLRWTLWAKRDGCGLSG